ncbi:MAG: orotate phosphoribosyltransferase [Actinomycetota bacterium]|nr:orotate phosphoribosyltransferase [Actinomycetota bacterium]
MTVPEDRTSSAAHQELGRDLVAAAYLRGDFVLSSGARSSFYFDKYLFETKPAILRRVAASLAQMVPDGIDRLAGPELGAVALAAAVSLETGIPFVIVRKESKDHGTAKEVEGEIQPGERVLVVEDVITSAGEALKAAARLEGLGVEVAGILAVLDREQTGAANISAAGYSMDALFRLSELDVRA